MKEGRKEGNGSKLFFFGAARSKLDLFQNLNVRLRLYLTHLIEIWVSPSRDAALLPLRRHLPAVLSGLQSCTSHRLSRRGLLQWSGGGGAATAPSVGVTAVSRLRSRSLARSSVEIIWGPIVNWGGGSKTQRSASESCPPERTSSRRRSQESSSLHSRQTCFNCTDKVANGNQPIKTENLT